MAAKPTAGKALSLLQLHYLSKCSHGRVTLAKGNNTADSRLIEKYLHAMYDNHRPGEELSREMWQMYYTRFAGGIDQGYHDGLSQFDPEVAAKLKQNIAQFSGYKEASFKRDIAGLLGKTREEFIAEAKRISGMYHEQWMQTEYHHAVAAANMTARWQNFEERKHLYPNLRYIAVQDGRTRDTHAAWHGTVLPIDDPWWDTHLPPNDWGCRCNVVQTDEPTTRPPTGEAKNTFANNPAKSGKVFVESGYEKSLTTEEKKEAVLFSEFQKLQVPLKTQYTAQNGATVMVSPFADRRPDEFVGNYRAAKLLADQEGLNIELTAHLDGRIAKKTPNPEYRIDGKIGDRKAPNGQDYINSLRGANLQNCEVVVFDLSRNKADINAAYDRIVDLLSHLQKGKPVYPSIKEFYIISQDGKEIKHYKRKKAD